MALTKNKHSKPVTLPPQNNSMNVSPFATHLMTGLLLGTSLFLACHLFWFPHPTFDAHKIGELILLTVTLGILPWPFFTLLLTSKPRSSRQKRVGLALIFIGQTAFLVPPTFIIISNRPVYIVYNSGQFNSVSWAEIRDGTTKHLRPDVPKPSFFGPAIVGAVQPDDPEARNQIMFSAAEGGADIYHTLELLVPYSQVSKEASRRSLSPSRYHSQHGGTYNSLKRLASPTGQGNDNLALLPLLIRETHATAIINRDSGKITGFALPN